MRCCRQFIKIVINLNPFKLNFQLLISRIKMLLDKKTYFQSYIFSLKINDLKKKKKVQSLYIQG